MIIFLQKSSFLFLFILSNLLVNAQNLKDSKQVENKPSVPQSSIGIKQQSASSVEVNDFKNMEANHSSPINSDMGNGVSNLPNYLNQKNQLLENILFDYNQMPMEVQKKIDLNKATGKNLLDGIAKAFTVEIKSCTNSVSAKTELVFLEKDSRFLNTEFVSAGIVRLNVINSFDSVELKELMLGAGISFNFLNEFYFVKN